MFGPSFKANKCKTACRLCTSRIKLLRSKRNIQLSQMRKEIGNLLANEKDEYAWIRVEAVMREKNLLAGYEILELYLELVAVRCQLLEKAKECPSDMVEAITSLMYAAPRVADLPELHDVRKILGNRFGKELGVEGQKGQQGEPQGWQVNVNLRHFLDVKPPEPENKLRMLSKIAQEMNIPFDQDSFYQTVMVEDPVVPEPPIPEPLGMPSTGLPPKQEVAVGGPDGSLPARVPLAQDFAATSVAPVAPVSYPPANTPPLPEASPVIKPARASALPPENPDFRVPHYGPTKGQYTEAQEAATAAYKAADMARRAADVASQFVQQATAPSGAVPPHPPPPPVETMPPASEEPTEINPDGPPPPPPAPPVQPPPAPVQPPAPPPVQQQPPAADPKDSLPQYPPPQFKVKTPDELQKQYDSALGAPEKKSEDVAPSAPPANKPSEDVPELPSPPEGNVDEDVGLPSVPGGSSDFPPVSELDELDKRFEELKKK